MSIKDRLPDYTIKICDGSGFLFKLFSSEYFYVLTAKHVVENKDEIQISRQRIDLDTGKLLEEYLEVIGTPYFHANENIDAAIIKVKTVDNLDYILRLEDIHEQKEQYLLTGHPSVRRDGNFSIRIDELTISNIKENRYIEGQLEKIAGYSEMVGSSGGGIVAIDKGQFYLAGIQTRMSAGDDEMMGRVDFMPITFYDEIVKQNPYELSELLPAYLNCFSHLKNEIIKLNGCCFDLTYTKEFLRNYTQKILDSNLTPHFIKNHFKEKLLIHNQSTSALNEKGLWIAWLEFLIFMNILKSTSINEESLQELFNSHRLIFSNTTKDWSTEMGNIVRSDFTKINNDGKVIVSTNSIPEQCIISEGALPDIIRGSKPQRNELKIDQGSNYPLATSKLFHLHAFQRVCIIQKEIEYKDFSFENENELLDKLKQEYDALFN